ncbi:aspartate/glutamate racemase family protein [Amycolatopsis pigmentata]|uniref:Aspartate/glutamate racemase family protein n=1 Tax=Amycolatopsis pigmentata TaxID=450801 RepID=A0ABW5G1T1_9PSEU
MKTIGLLGGLSWESSLEYYRVLNRAARARFGGSESAYCVLQSLNFGEIEDLFHAERYDDIAELMIAGARTLERAGAEFMVICSNTSHFWAEKIAASVDMPVLNIVDVAAAAVKSAGIDKVGLIGTELTMEQGFYRDRLLERHGVSVVTPAKSERADIEGVIFGELVRGAFRSESRRRYLEIIENLVDRGAQGVILGCTEIELLVPPDEVGHLVSVPLFPTTRLHALAAFACSIGEYVAEYQSA